METICMNTVNSKTNEQQFILNLSERLNLRSSNTYVAPQNLPIYCMWQKRRQQYKNDKLKKTAPTWNDKSELSKGSYSVSDIQDYFDYTIKNMKHYPLILLFKLTSTGLLIDKCSK